MVFVKHFGQVSSSIGPFTLDSPGWGFYNHPLSKIIERGSYGF
jgi:hypothetical protein